MNEGFIAVTMMNVLMCFVIHVSESETRNNFSLTPVISYTIL